MELLLSLMLLLLLLMLLRRTGGWPRPRWVLAEQLARPAMICVGQARQNREGQMMRQNRTEGAGRERQRWPLLLLFAEFGLGQTHVWSSLAAGVGAVRPRQPEARLGLIMAGHVLALRWFPGAHKRDLRVG